jgi:GNAT superfamily N-acetyltransferase
MREGLALAARDLAEQYAALEPTRFTVPDREAQVAHFREVLSRPPRADVAWLVAEVDGEAVARRSPSSTSRRRTPKSSRSSTSVAAASTVGYLAVQARFRGRGIGGRLLGAVEDWARAQGAELISTDTNLRANLGAVEFYERHGYVRQSVVMRKLLSGR